MLIATIERRRINLNQSSSSFCFRIFGRWESVICCLLSLTKHMYYVDSFFCLFSIRFVSFLFCFVSCFVSFSVLFRLVFCFLSCFVLFRFYFKSSCFFSVLFHLITAYLDRIKFRPSSCRRCIATTIRCNSRVCILDKVRIGHNNRPSILLCTWNLE